MKIYLELCYQRNQEIKKSRNPLNDKLKYDESIDLGDEKNIETKRNYEMRVPTY
jgi:hypothetical protein